MTRRTPVPTIPLNLTRRWIRTNPQAVAEMQSIGMRWSALWPSGDAYLQEFLAYEQVADQPPPADGARLEEALAEFRQDVNLVRLLGSEGVRDQAMAAFEAVAQLNSEAQEGEISEEDENLAFFEMGVMVEVARNELT